MQHEQRSKHRLTVDIGSDHREAVSQQATREEAGQQSPSTEGHNERLKDQRTGIR